VFYLRPESLVLYVRSETSYRSQLKITHGTRSVDAIGIAEGSALARREIVFLRFMTVREARSEVLTRNFRGELCTQVTMRRRCDYNGVDRSFMTTIIIAEIVAPLEMT